jgi:hypothetical protein
MNDQLVLDGPGIFKEQRQFLELLSKCPYEDLVVLSAHYDRIRSICCDSTSTIDRPISFLNEPVLVLISCIRNTNPGEEVNHAQERGRVWKYLMRAQTLISIAVYCPKPGSQNTFFGVLTGNWKYNKQRERQIKRSRNYDEKKMIEYREHCPWFA